MNASRLSELNKLLRKVALIVSVLVLGGFTLVCVLLKTPAFRQYVSAHVSGMLSDKFGTEVSIKGIEPGLFNSVILSGVDVKDQSGRDLLSADRISVKIRLRSIFSGPFTVRTLELYRADVNLIRKDRHSPYNFQFIIDSLSSGTKKQSGSLHFSLKSLILNSCNVSHTVLSSSRRTTFDPDHASFRNIYASFGLKTDSGSGFSFLLRDLSLAEVSGLKITRSFLYGEYRNGRLTVPRIDISMPGSRISLKDVAFYRDRHGKISGHISLLPSIISLSDASPFVSRKFPDLNFTVSAGCNIRGGNVLLRDVSLRSRDRSLSLFATADIRVDSRTLRVRQLHAERKPLLAILGYFLPSAVSHPSLSSLRQLDFSGFASQKGRNITSGGSLSSNLGNVRYEVSLGGDGSFRGDAYAEGVDAGDILGKKYPLGKSDFRLRFSGMPASCFTLSADISRLTYGGHTVSPISLTLRRDLAKWTLNAVGGNDAADMKVAIEATNPAEHGAVYGLTAAVNHFRPGAYGIGGKMNGRDFSGNFKATLMGDIKSPSYLEASFSDGKIRSADSITALGNMKLAFSDWHGYRRISLRSSSADADIRGHYDIPSLASQALSILSKGRIKKPGTGDNIFDFRIVLRSAEFVNLLTSQSMRIDGSTALSGYMDSRRRKMQVILTSPFISWSGHDMSNVSLYATADDSDSKLRFHALSMKDGVKGADLEAIADDKGNGLGLSLIWRSYGERHNSGEIDQHITFAPPEEGGIVSVLSPSSFFAGDSLCRVESGKLTYRAGKLNIDRLDISSGSNSLYISGDISKSADDSVNIYMNGVRLQSVLDFLSFDDVQFDGNITGKATIAAVMGKPRLNATLRSSDFIFNHAHMGKLNLSAYWRSGSGHIDIFSAILDDSGNSTNISGYVSPPDDYIDLHFLSYGTNALFLNDFLPDGLSLKSGSVTGNLRLYGDLHAMNLAGKESISGALMQIEPLGTQYQLDCDTVDFSRDLIAFRSDTLRDRDGNAALLSGAVRHRALHDFSYDLSINTPRLLAYDVPHMLTDASFWGTAFASGRIHVYGGPGFFRTDADVRTLPGTVFTYNSESSGGDATPELLTFRSANAPSVPVRGDTAVKAASAAEGQKVKRSDMTLNFHFDITPDAEVRVITDEEAGNMASVRGFGRINANWENKGDFRMYGAYNVASGNYRMKFHDLLERNFSLQEGGKVTFSGAPLDGALSLKAVYTLPSVSLSGLSAGSNMRDASERVDCIMNITGTASSPAVNFDIDVPDASAAQRQMVKSIISTPEDMNLQAMYLLSVGQFYTYDYSPEMRYQNASRSSIAMNSFLSGTISQNFEKFLRDMGLNNDRWKFGTSLATGQEGWNDVDVEGIFSARLLSGRLLIDGNVGYRDRAAYTSNIVGDFTARYLLNKAGTIQLKAYSESNDRYFTRHSLTTQGGGILFRKDFNNIRDLFRRKKAASR